MKQYEKEILDKIIKFFEDEFGMTPHLELNPMIVEDSTPKYLDHYELRLITKINAKERKPQLLFKCF